MTYRRSGLASTPQFCSDSVLIFSNSGLSAALVTYSNLTLASCISVSTSETAAQNRCGSFQHRRRPQASRGLGFCYDTYSTTTEVLLRHRWDIAGEQDSTSVTVRFTHDLTDERKRSFNRSPFGRKGARRSVVSTEKS